MNEPSRFNLARQQEQNKPEIIPAMQSATPSNAEFDMQIATAKRYPRNLSIVKQNSLAIVTMDRETAESCRYTLPRGGKNISGASVHLARILSQSYGNMRVQTRLKDIGQTTVTAEAIAFDLESNYAVSMEVSRSIVGNKGRYNNDMINTTGMAACAIAFRNAVFSVIPKALVEVCYKKAAEVITGDLSDETKLIQKRNVVINYFIETYGVTKEEVLTAAKVRSENQIKQEQILDLKGLAQALKDGDVKVEEIFPKNAPEDKNEKMSDRIKRSINKETGEVTDEQSFVTETSVA